MLDEASAQDVERKHEAEAEAQLKRLPSTSGQEASKAHQGSVTALVDAGQATPLKTQDSKQLHYIIRGCEASAGCVPCQIFEAEPGLLLNRMHNAD